MEDYKVDKWSTICMKNIHYSVPDTLVGKTVSVKIYSEKVVIFHGQVKMDIQRNMPLLALHTVYLPVSLYHVPDIVFANRQKQVIEIIRLAATDNSLLNVRL